MLQIDSYKNSVIRTYENLWMEIKIIAKLNDEILNFIPSIYLSFREYFGPDFVVKFYGILFLFFRF